VLLYAGRVAANKIDVVAVILEREGRFLLGKRSLHKQSAPGYWCPISGHMEPGESQAAAVAREVLEETALRVMALDCVARCDTHDGSAVMHWWRAQPLDDAPARLANDEHSELGWFSPQELRRLSPVFEEDIAILLQAARRASP
jgi:8-oxo-dGTP pyrophosphatase MutT (NUDIX family)